MAAAAKLCVNQQHIKRPRSEREIHECIRIEGKTAILNQRKYFYKTVSLHFEHK